MIPQVFKVLTEFRFEIGSAVANTKTLQGAVGGLSAAADQALFSFQRLGVGLVGQLGLGSGSILGLLGSAIKASDKFGQSQRGLANVFLSNNMFQGADAFEKAMAASAKSMENIQRKAQEFSLPATEMTEFTKLIGASLISHGMDDASLKKSTDISRGFLKSAPVLGISPSLAQGQLLDAVMGRANMGDTLFQRLMNETSAMKQFKGKPQAYNALPDEKRIAVLTKSLMQFGSNTKILEANARSMNGELQRTQDLFTGMYSILRPIGDVIAKAILPSFHAMNDYLQNQGSAMAKNFAKMLDGIISDPKTMLTNLLQLRKLQGSVNSAGSLATTYAAFLGIWHILGLMGLRLTAVIVGFVGLGSGLALLAIGLKSVFGFLARGLTFLTGKASMGSALFAAANGLTSLFSRVFWGMALMTGVFQLFARAIAIARVYDMQAIAQSMPRFMEAMTKLKTAFMHLATPFIKIFDSVAQGISPIFRFAHWFDMFISLVEVAGDVVMLFQAAFQGIMFAILQFVDNMKALMNGSGNWNVFKGVGDAFNSGVDMMIEDIMGKIESGDAVVNATTNISKVEINNQFKEQMEPDRIAFTLKEQLLKAAANRGQASRRTTRLAEVMG